MDQQDVNKKERGYSILTNYDKYKIVYLASLKLSLKKFPSFFVFFLEFGIQDMVLVDWGFEFGDFVAILEPEAVKDLVGHSQVTLMWREQGLWDKEREKHSLMKKTKIQTRMTA